MYCVPTTRVQRWLIALIALVVSASAPLTAVAQSSGPPPSAHTEVFGSDEDDPTPTPSGVSGGDAATYLSDVRDHADGLRTSIDRFFELTGGAPLDEDGIGELLGIMLSWRAALGIAEDVVVPQGMADVQSAYIDFVTALGEMYSTERARLKTEEGTAERDEALAEFETALDEAYTAYDALDALLTDQGA
jgi:hypothetical protein